MKNRDNNNNIDKDFMKDFRKRLRLDTKEFCVLYVGVLRLVIAFLLLLLLPVTVSPYAILLMIVLLAVDIYVFSIGTQYKLAITVSLIMIITTFFIRIYAITFDGEIVIIVTNVILLTLITILFLYQTYMSMKYVYRRISEYEKELNKK